MTISVDEFVKKYDGKAVDFDKKYGAQCVDLFNFYNSEVVGAPWIGTPVTGGARDLYEVDSPARAQYYKKLGADSQLQAGDVEVFADPHGRYIENGRQYFLGHVRIYIGNGKYIEQNGKVSKSTAITDKKLIGLLGILRPLRFIGENSPHDVPSTTTTKNKHTIQKGDTFWGLEESRGWSHGILQSLNPSLDPKKLSVGSEINIPGEKKEEPKSEERYYTIKSGDTFWDLENGWQQPHGTLQRLNPALDPRKLGIGQRIRIK